MVRINYDAREKRRNNKEDISTKRGEVVNNIGKLRCKHT